MADEIDPRSGELTTANYGWTKPNVGNSADAWGGFLNADLDGIDSTVKSVSTVANAAYPASNPSGYQTAAQVTASLGSYLPLVGVTNGSDAPAGQIGEYMTASQGTATSLTSATPLSLAGMTLTPGDWDVWGRISFTATSATTVTLQGAVNTTVNALGPNPVLSPLPPANQGGITVPTIRISSASSTPVWITAAANFAAGTITATGSISARRRR